MPYRVVWVLAAALLMIIGVLITPLPGPGPLIVIPAGLAMLALEFEWAERLLEWVLVQANRATSGLSRGAKIAAVIMALAGITAFFVLTYYVDIPILPDA